MPVILMDHHLKIGSTVRTYHEWRSGTNDNVPAERADNSYIYTFFRQHEVLLHSLMRGHNLGPYEEPAYAEIA